MRVVVDTFETRGCSNGADLTLNFYKGWLEVMQKKNTAQLEEKNVDTVLQVTSEWAVREMRCRQMMSCLHQMKC